MLLRVHRSFLLSLCILTLMPGVLAAPPSGVALLPEQRATAAITVLQAWYNPQTGLYRTTGWWNSANAITALADYSRLIGSQQFVPVFANTFAAAQKRFPGFLNRYYDDEGWWALAWVDVYDQTRDPQYLAMASSIFTDMTGAWDNTCSGGIWWSKDRTYKNAIANELFLSVAAHLATRPAKPENEKQYLSWATREWQWFSKSGMINAGHLVNDGLDAHCANNGKTAWTYNQGVILGALAELSRAAGDDTVLPQARLIAAAALTAPSLVDAHGILHEPCEPKCGGDGSQFKGIFVRNLQSLAAVTPITGYDSFIGTNSASVWSQTHDGNYDLGLIWSAPFGIGNASTQSSAIDLLLAALKIDTTPPS